MSRVLRVALAVVFVLMLGCGSEPEQTAPKETLTDKEKQQVQDLNKQRQDEWGSTKNANKNKK